MLINSNTVIRARRLYSDGVHGYSFNGTTTINSTFVETSGYHSEGIYAYGWLGATVNSGAVKTCGNYYHDGIHCISNNGMANVTSGYVLTEGTGSSGIYAFGYYGVNVNSGTVITTGDFATGIQAILELRQGQRGLAACADTRATTAGINAYGYYGATVNNTGLVLDLRLQVWTGGVADAFDSDITVTSEEVVTYGDYSRGISAYTDNGNVKVTVEDRKRECSPTATPPLRFTRSR